MKVRDVMTRDVETISPDATLEQAAKRMTARNVGVLPVVEEKAILGIVTDRDIVVRGLGQGYSPHLTTLRQVMTPKPLWCYEDQSVTEISRLMEQNLVRRVIVLNRNEQLVGVVSLSDLAVKVPNERVSGHVLCRISAAA